MIRFPNTRYSLSQEVKVAPYARFTAEGQAAVYTEGATVEGVLPSTGTATDIFAGFVVAGGGAAPFMETYTNAVDEMVVTDEGTVTLRFAPISAAAVLVVKASDDSVVTDAITVADKTISGLDNVAGEVVRITYKYEMTYRQAVALQGDSEIGGYSGAQVDQIGVITRGRVFISEYDTSVDWRTAEKITLAANGQVTADGTGTEIKGFVIQVPTHEEPFLGIEFDTL